MPSNNSSTRTSKQRRNNKASGSSFRSYGSQGRNNKSSSRVSQRTHSRSHGSRYAKQKALDPSFFTREVTQYSHNEPLKITHTFSDFDIADKLLSNIVHKGYLAPTPIQDQTIPQALNGNDIVGMANTGTGKTAAFLLPIINHLLQEKKQKTRALIVAPTRELAQQINEEFRSFTNGLKLYSTMCVGGLSINKQASQLRRHPHVVVGTPGRLKDLYDQKILDLSNISYFVLDEVDLMLDMGFINDIRYIVNAIPEERQTLCFSATMTDSITTLIGSITTDPIHVSVKTGSTSDNVSQSVVYARRGKDKWSQLVNILDMDECEKALIFCETKSFVQSLSDDLNKHGIATEAIHGDKSQPQRQKALKKFKDNKVDILVATDVAARGLDIPNVSHVINYDAPRIYDDYVHRIGRTGRAGQLGKAITFVKPESSANAEEDIRTDNTKKKKSSYKKNRFDKNVHHKRNNRS